MDKETEAKVQLWRDNVKEADLLEELEALVAAGDEEKLNDAFYRDLAFGTGDTPLAGLFALMLREGWRFPCDIELEYAIPKDSDAVREVDVSRRFCRSKIA